MKSNLTEQQRFTILHALGSLSAHVLEFYSEQHEYSKKCEEAGVVPMTSDEIWEFKKTLETQ